MIEAPDLTLHDIQRRMIVAADAVQESLTEYRVRSTAWVDAERAHRHARAIRRPELKASLVADKEDELFLKTREEWFQAEMAKALKDSAKEALRASQAILSGLQSLAGAHREEARLAHYEPRETA